MVCDGRSNGFYSFDLFIMSLFSYYFVLHSVLVEVMFDEEEETPTILKREVEDVIVHLRKNRTPADDGILNEYLKRAGEKLIEIITLIFNKIITTEEIHKKGNREDLRNYRPISLLPNLYDLFMKILTNNITKINR